MIKIPKVKDVLLAGFTLILLGVFLQEYVFKLTSSSDKIAYWSAILSLCSFLGLLYTVNLQIKEMADNRKEFQDMNFNDIFFNLINTQNQIKENIKYEYIKKGYNNTDNEDTIGDTFFDNAINDIELIFELKNEIKYPVPEVKIYISNIPVFEKLTKTCLFYNIQEREFNMIKTSEHISELIGLLC